MGAKGSEIMSLVLSGLLVMMILYLIGADERLTSEQKRINNAIFNATQLDEGTIFMVHLDKAAKWSQLSDKAKKKYASKDVFHRETIDNLFDWHVMSKDKTQFDSTVLAEAFGTKGHRIIYT